MNDILSSTASQDNKSVLEKTFSSPLKEAREHFEKEYLMTQLKKIMEMFLKQQILLEWNDLLYTENFKKLGIKGIN